MTISNDTGKKVKKTAKKLALKKETVKDLDIKPGKGKELGDDQLDAVNGGVARLNWQGLPKTRNKAECAPFRTTRLSNCCA